MRIAIVCRVADGFGGTTRTILEHAKRLAARGDSVDVVADRLDPDAVRAAGARAVQFIGWPFGSRMKRRFFAWRADRLAGGYDLVHGHGDNFEARVLSLHNCVHAAHEAVHGAPLPDDDAQGALHAELFRARRYRVLIANSRLMADDLRRRFGVPEERLRVIHPGFDRERFRAEDRERLRPAARAELGLAEGDVAMGLVTSGDFAKRGVARFLRAFAAARARQPSARAVVAGKEARLEPYRRLAAELGVSERVLFLEPRRDVEQVYHALDVYVHPAAWEEFGQSVQEALACGLPVLTGPRVGAAELFPPEAARCRLESDDEGELAARLVEVAAHRAWRVQLGALGARAVAGNGWDANFAATAAVYAELAGGVPTT